MKRLFCLTAFTLAALLCGTALAETNSPDQAPSPTAVVMDRQHTFQPVPDGSEVRHDFIIQNTGQAPLKIQRVKSG